MTAKEFLARYKKAKAEESNLRAEIEKVDKMIGVKGNRLDGLPRKHAPNHPTEDMAFRLIELKSRYEVKLAERIRISEEVVDTINSLSDHRCITLLYMRYCNGDEWDTIANELNYSPDYVQKELHEMALAMLEVTINV